MGLWLSKVRAAELVPSCGPSSSPMSSASLWTPFTRCIVAEFGQFSGFTPTYYPLHRLTPTLPGCVPGPKDGMVTVQDTVDNRYPWRHPIEHLESKAAGENSQAAMQAT